MWITEYINKRRSFRALFPLVSAFDIYLMENSSLETITQNDELSDEELQKLVEACKKKRLERTLSEMSQDQEGR